MDGNLIDMLPDNYQELLLLLGVIAAGVISFVRTKTIKDKVVVVKKYYPLIVAGYPKLKAAFLKLRDFIKRKRGA